MLLESDLLPAPHDTARTRISWFRYRIGTARQQRVSHVYSPTEYGIRSAFIIRLHVWRFGLVRVVTRVIERVRRRLYSALLS